MIDFRIGKYDCLNSTNLFLRDRIKVENPMEGLVIQTENQMAGRGYGENSWESEDGKNLLFSFYLKPDFLAAAQQFYLSMVVSLTLINVLKQVSAQLEFSIKWPNDIYFGKNKIAGILVENSVQGASISDSIIGVGLNINQESFPNELPNPVSLFQITNRIWDRDKILILLLKEFNKQYDRLQKSDFNRIENHYLVSLFLMNIKSKYIVDNEIIEGEITGIDKFGRLNILSDGALRSFGFKEVEYVI